MARAENTEIIDRFEEFYRNYYRNDIGELAQRYPNEQRSLYVDWGDLYRFDPDLAEDFRTKPEQMQEYAEEALRLYDLPVDVKLGRAHVRVVDLGEITEIRDIRARHRGNLLSVQGIVRKATDVRPKIREAAFECQRCGTLTHIPQSGGDFQEPHECQGCERQGPFKINFDQSEFVDAQKLRVQESPEGLRGGETPQSIDVHIEDDITGKVTAGDHVRVTGVLHLDQQGSRQEKSTVFDHYMEGVSVEIEDEQFEDMDITEADKREIIELSSDPDIYEKMVDSMAPSIYGYRQQKLAIILQLFSGVTKHLPDGSRVRGDLHMLLIGDPGTGKCVRGDTDVTLSNGQRVPIQELVERNLDDPKPVDDGVYDDIHVRVPSLTAGGDIIHRRATRVWKREAPDRMYRIRTRGGRELEVTPSHPLFVQSGGEFSPLRAEDLTPGQFIATPRKVPTTPTDTLDVGVRRSRADNAVRLDLPEKWTPWLARLVGFIVAEGHVSLNRDRTGDVRVTNEDTEVLRDVERALDRLGLNWTRDGARTGKSAKVVRCNSGEFASFLANLEPAILARSAEQRVPGPLFRTGEEIKKAFLKAYVEGEGHVSAKQRELTVASTSRELLDGVRTLLLSLGIGCSIGPRQNGSHRLRIGGEDFLRYVRDVGFVTDRKHEAPEAVSDGPRNTNTDIVPAVGDELQRVREALSLSQSDCGLPRSTYQHYERGDRNPSRGSLRTVVDAFEERLAWLRDVRQQVVDGTWSDVERVRQELSISQQSLAEGMDASQTAISYYERNDAIPDGGHTEDTEGVVLDHIDSALSVEQTVDALRQLASSDVRWDRIDSIEAVEPNYDWVYDIEVEGTHNYLSNGIVSHNSQLLQYIRNLAPRSVYTSGKGSSSAGLCVTGDTLVHTEEGFRPIRKIVTEELPDPVDTETGVERAISVRTYDRTTGEMTDGTSSHVWRMPEKPCRRIETSHGKELEASINTPVLTCGPEGVEWRAISDVGPGDHIAVPRHDDADRSEVPVREFLELTTEKVRLSNESVSFLRESLQERFGTLRDAAAALDLSEDFVYLHLKNRHVPLAKLDRMLDAIGASRGDVRFDRVMLRHGDSITVPRAFDEDLMYLLGLVFGDGDISLDRRGGDRGMVRISNSDEALLERAAGVFDEKFDKRPQIEYQDDRVPCIRVNSATIARLFSNAGMQTPKDDLTLAPELTTAEHADAFLRGLMDADGAVSSRTDGGSSIQFSTISESLAQQVQLMLETYGVSARRRTRERSGEPTLANGYTIEAKHSQHHLAIHGRNIEQYATEIGFESAEKRAALGRILGDAERRGETIPVGSALATADIGHSGGEYYTNFDRADNPSRDRARDVLDTFDLGDSHPDIEEAVEADLRWDEVVAAVDTGEKEVYDLTVPDTHNFIGNGIVTHNTAAAVRDDFGEGQQWTLEAGALVLADQGIAAVDELDKMRCVTGDTLVSLRGGRTSRIRDLAIEAAETGTVESLPNGRTVRDVDLSVRTMTDDGRLVERPVTAVHEYDAPETLTEVTLESGESVTATRDHPFFVLEDGRRVERSAADLEPGDWLYVPRRLPGPAADGGAISTASSTPSEPQGCSPALGAVLGYLSGDGNVYYDRQEGRYGIRFTNKEEELLADFERVCRDAFDADPVRHPSEQRDDGVGTVRLHGREYADEVLDAGMNLETYEGKAFPEGLTGGRPDAKAAFVRAIADSEGHVDTASGNVTVTAASYELLLGVKSLLLEFGVSSQIRTRERAQKCDLYVLAITAADSLRAFKRHVGFTLDRKQSALDEVCGTVSGDRTIVDVLPQYGDVLAALRDSLRLHQSECGLADATYCSFENGDANISLHRAGVVLAAFEERIERANDDAERLASACDWQTLRRLKDRYHVSQAELAAGTAYRQQEVSEGWGEDETLRKTVRRRLGDIVEAVSQTDLTPLADRVGGNVKWRRVTGVEPVAAEADDDRVAVLRHELADVVGCGLDEAEPRARAMLSQDVRTGTWEELRAELDRYGVSFRTIATELGVAGSTVSRWFNGVVETDRFDEVRAVAEACIDDRRTRIRNLLTEIADRREPKVYDLTVDGTHNFVANGMVVHNSEDRSAMHQALEQQEISISKAGINATLKARCSLLGAANPKYGRFDQYESIGEQIDLEPALISRFDLIFTVTDQPDEEEDRRLAEHILKTNYAGELHTHHTESNNSNVTAEEVENVTDDVQPTIEADLLRKYVAHAKRSCFPTMTEEAKEAIQEFYVDLRARGQDEDAPVPVTARKLEALVRLAEASARVRLSDTVEQEDAERVIEIVRSCLEDVGMDPETGEFDADVVETGTSKSQRDRIKNIKSLIAEIEEEYEEGAPVEEVLDRAEQAGMERGKAEHEIEKLRRQGDVYEPTTDHLRTV